ncbi:hypothetical protein PY793_03085 [Acetobacter fabarum]|uniref:hypothetical protein n=1 Tax=Acetobacter fabarum TaxID=483199 RepID=UPI00312B5EF8
MNHMILRARFASSAMLRCQSLLSRMTGAVFRPAGTLSYLTEWHGAASRQILPHSKA